MQNIIFGIRDQNITEDTKSYIREKLEKLEIFTKEAENITVNIVSTKNHLGNYKDLNVEVLIKLPKAFVKVEDKGHNVNVIIDKIVQVLQQRLKRYHQNYQTRWADNSGWKTKELAKSMIVDEKTNNTEYEPFIKLKYYEDDSPMHPAEAVERMELLGHNSFMFKNIETGSYAMLYRRDKGGYGLVEPKK